MKTTGERNLDTTLGDLIAAVSDAAFEVCNDKHIAYLLASLALEDMIENDLKPSISGADAAARHKTRFQ